MLESLIKFIGEGLPSWLAVLVLGATPIGEVRIAIPLAREVYHLSWPAAIFWSVIGNLIPPLIIIYFLDGLRRFLVVKIPISSRFFDWLFRRTHAKFINQYEKYGALALIFFIGIPLPFTGAYTGSVAAFLFNIKPVRAVVYVFLGIILAALIVSLITLGIFR